MTQIKLQYSPEYIPTNLLFYFIHDKFPNQLHQLYKTTATLHLVLSFLAKKIANGTTFIYITYHTDITTGWLNIQPTIGILETETAIVGQKPLKFKIFHC